MTDFLDEPPQLDHVTPYDEAHLTTYIRLLDAEAEGANWREVVEIIFRLNPDKDPERAKHIHDSHLARAQWMAKKGYRELVKPRAQ